MRMFAAACLGLGLLSLVGPASAQGAERRVDVVFSATARGIPAGEFTYSFNQTGQSYQAEAQRRLSGLARAMMGRSQDYTYSVRGAVAANGVLRPAAYQHRGGRRDRLVNAAFSADDVVTTAEPHMGMGNPPATAEQKRGVVDQLTAIALLVTSPTEPCSRTIQVYMDGRSRFDFVLTPNGSIEVDTPAYRGRVVRCSVQFRPIAGFSDPQETETLTFLFARTASGLYAPIRIEMPTDNDQVGTVRLDARRLTINGEPLR
jgi:Protein of unknown function (DUF3108)